MSTIFVSLFSFSVLCPAMDVEAQGNHIDELSFNFYIPYSLTYPPFPSAPSSRLSRARKLTTLSQAPYGLGILNVRLHG